MIKLADIIKNQFGLQETAEKHKSLNYQIGAEKKIKSAEQLKKAERLKSKKKI